MKNCSGFSLIELLIVLVILGVLSALAVPNLLAARRAANEASAIASIKSFLNAEHVYYAAQGTFTSPGQLYAEHYISDDFGTLEYSALPPSGAPPAEEAEGSDVDDSNNQDVMPEEDPMEFVAYESYFTKAGYQFKMVPTEVVAFIDTFGRFDLVVSEFYMVAQPLSDIMPSTFKTGVRSFYIDSISNQPFTVEADTDGGLPECIDEETGEPNYENCEQVVN